MKFIKALGIVAVLAGALIAAKIYTTHSAPRVTVVSQSGQQLPSFFDGLSQNPSYSPARMASLNDMCQEELT